MHVVRRKSCVNINGAYNVSLNVTDVGETLLRLHANLSSCNTFLMLCLHYA